MTFHRFLPALVLVLLAFPASAGATLSESSVSASEKATRADAATSRATAAARIARKPGRVIRTRRSWECRGSLRRYGRLPIKVISNMRNPGNGDAIRLIGCYGDGNRRTIDLILDVNGNGRGRGTAFDAVRIGQNAHDLDVTGDAECGRKHTNPNIHQDIVQALSGRRIVFRRFTSGNPFTGRWTCWGAGGGWYVTWANGRIPSRLICHRCRLAAYNQNLRQVLPLRRAEVGLRLPPLLRDLHRAGSEEASQREEPRHPLLVDANACKDPALLRPARAGSERARHRGGSTRRPFSKRPRRGARGEAARMRLFPGVGYRGRPRRAWVIGSGIDMWELVDFLRSYGGDGKKLRDSHPLVSDRHLRLARAYAERFPDEIEELLEPNARPLDELRALYPFLEVAE